MITIVKANSKKLLLEFVKFPFSLYKNHPYWVPPLIQDELETFDKDKNPAFVSAEAQFYLAYKDNKVVGRIAAIINWDEVNDQQKKKVRFGWWDVIDDVSVTKVLLEKVYELGRTNNLEYVEGPMGFSNLDKVGVLTEGFDDLGSMITWYNYPYYKEHLEALGYVQEKEYLENKFPFSNVKPEAFEKIVPLIKKRYQLKELNFSSNKAIMPYVDKMFDLFNSSYANLSSFVAITDVQKEYFKKKYISFINPEYIKFVMDKDDNMVAFSIVMPSFSRAFKKLWVNYFRLDSIICLKQKKKAKRCYFI
jgi:hypothetical protein